MEAVILYAAGRGLAEPVRLTLHYLGVAWREEHLRSPDHLAELRAQRRLPFEQIPGYEIDGHVLSETPSVLRYLARTRGLEPPSEVERLRADMLLERFLEVRTAIAYRPCRADPEAERDRIVKVLAPKCVRRIELWLATNPGTEHGFFAERSYVDLFAYDALTWLLELDPDALEGHDRLAGVYRAIGEDAKIRSFYASDRHFPPPDQAYVDHVQWVLGRRPAPT